MSLKVHVLRRLLGLAPLLLAISFVSFALVSLSPSDPAEVVLRVNTNVLPSPEAVAEMRAKLGLDRPYLERYAHWLGRALTGDFGTSYVNGRPVADLLAEAVPPTLMLGGTAAALLLLASVPAALLAARFENRAPDLLVRFLVFLATSVPSYWMGLLLIWFLSVHLDLLPTGGMDDGWRSLVLPAATLALPYLATYTRLLRAGMLNAGRQNFVLYLRTLGRRPRAVLAHVFRNSLQSSLTGLGMSLPKLVAGAFVVECVFAWPGVGRLCVEAVFNRDFPVIQAYVLIMAVLVVLFNLLFDVIRVLVDPRLREEGVR